MGEKFNGFAPVCLDYFLGISLDNSRDFFMSHKEIYEQQVRAPFIEMMNELALEFGGTVKVFRPNRDVRFSADKRPYKTNMSGYIAGAPDGALRYADLSAEGLLAATGYYQMAKDQLERFRSALNEGDDFLKLGAELREIVERDGVDGEALKTAPRGISKDAPNLDLMRYKSLTIGATIPFEEAHHEGALAHVRSVWKKGEPLNEWLGNHVGQSLLERRF